jgi:hypothetical protein
VISIKVKKRSLAMPRSQKDPMEITLDFGAILFLENSFLEMQAALEIDLYSRSS